MDEYIGPQLTDVVQGGQAPTNQSIEPQTQGDIDNSKVPSDENFVPDKIECTLSTRILLWKNRK